MQDIFMNWANINQDDVDKYGYELISNNVMMIPEKVKCPECKIEYKINNGDEGQDDTEEYNDEECDDLSGDI